MKHHERTIRAPRMVLGLLAATSGPSAACGYLLVAQPQSSSTSTMLSTSEMMSIGRKQDFRCWCANVTDPFCMAYDGAGVGNEHGMRYGTDHVFHPFNDHLDVCDTKASALAQWVKVIRVYKQHLTPTRHHLRAILYESQRACRRIVVLLRNAWAAAQSYCQRLDLEQRDQKQKQYLLKMISHKPPPDTRQLEARWRDLHNSSSARSLARQYLAHHAFGEGWRTMQRLWPDLILVINYEEMQDPAARAATLERAVRWWGARQNASFVQHLVSLVNRTGGPCERLMRSQVAPVAKALAARPPPNDDHRPSTIPVQLPPSMLPWLDERVPRTRLRNGCVAVATRNTTGAEI